MEFNLTSLYYIEFDVFRRKTPKKMSSIKRDLDARARSDAFRLVYYCI